MNHTKEISEDRLKVLIEKSQIRVTDIYDKPPVAIRIEESTLGSLGGFSGCIGPAKSRKTFNATAIAAAAITGKMILKYEVVLPEDKRNVLFIDTEQPVFWAKTVVDRIVKQCFGNIEKHPDNFRFLSFRPYSPRERIDLIEYVLKSIPNVGIMIIDGVRDLAFDINSPHEATEVITKLMKWSYDYKLHIHTILHQNKNDANARGHLGTELINKSESIIEVRKSDKDKNISLVSGSYTRDKDFEPFAFTIDNDELPILIDYELNEDQKDSTEREPENFEDQYHLNLLDDIYKDSEIYSKNELGRKVKNALRRYDVKLGDNKTRIYVQYYIDKKFVKNLGNESYMKLAKNY